MLHIGNKTYNLGIQKGKILYLGGNKLGPIIPDEVPSTWYNCKTDTNVSKSGEPTTSSVVYDNPDIQSELTVLEEGS